MEENVPEGLTVFSLTANHRRRLRTTIGLERLNRQIRRRTRVPVLFPNTTSCSRLVTAIVIEISEEVQTGCNYIRPDDND
jgi:transposase-like protein